MAHKYDYDTGQTLIDVATHVTNHPDLEPPISVTLRKENPQLLVSFESYAAWLNSAGTVGIESFKTGIDNVTVAACAIRLGDSVYTMKAITFLPRRAAANLIGWQLPVQVV